MQNSRKTFMNSCIWTLDAKETTMIRSLTGWIGTQNLWTAAGIQTIFFLQHLLVQMCTSDQEREVAHSSTEEAFGRSVLADIYYVNQARRTEGSFVIFKEDRNKRFLRPRQKNTFVLHSDPRSLPPPLLHLGAVVFSTRTTKPCLLFHARQKTKLWAQKCSYWFARETTARLCVTHEIEKYIILIFSFFFLTHICFFLGGVLFWRKMILFLT